MAVTAATATALMLASCASAPEPTALAAAAIDFYENEPIGIDLSCESLAGEVAKNEPIFEADDMKLIEAAINARAEKEGCVAP